MRLWLLLFIFAAPVWNQGAEFRAGAAAVDITPDYPIRLSGYVARKSESEGVRLHLFSKALAISEGNGKAALMITVDNVGISREIRNEIAARLQHQFSIPSERIVIFSSHTHSAPALSNAIANIFAMDIPSEQQAKIDRYTGELIEKVTSVAAMALKDLEPARLYWASGNVEFAKNRRTPGGPVDHDLPILAVKTADGKLKAVLANYACHCTTLQGDHNFIHGDWSGVAQEEIAKRNPGALGLISIGCGADSNPSPRGQFEHVLTHGQEIASEVQRLLGGPMTELTEKPIFRGRLIELPYAPLPTREEWKKRAMESGIVGYHAKKNLERVDRGETLPNALPYIVQSWNFGKQLEMVFLAGEVVVDYSLTLKKQFDRNRLWVSGYANWVPCYIPSLRILNEGGYEAEESLWYYDRPARLSTNTEALIIEAVRSIVPSDFKVDGIRKSAANQVKP